MIPRRIRLRNFLSYQECEVDFSGLHVAVLTGRNGDGKSALLDAMTWAVWGEARGRTEEDRIRLGASEMIVEFEFEAMGSNYRVIRKRTRGRSTGDLQFLAVDADGREYPAGGGTMRETQAEINRRIGMDYQTFSNSAFVAQGEAGEFTRQTAPERKQVFRKILGLELYEELASAAGDRDKTARASLHMNEALADQTRAEVELGPGFEADLAQARTAREALAPQVAAAEGLHLELRQLAAEHERLVASHIGAAARFERALQARTAAEADLSRLRADLITTQSVLEEGPQLEARHNRLSTCRARDRDLQELQREAQELQREVDRVESRIREEGGRLESTLTGQRRDLERLEAAAAQVTELEQREAALAGRRGEIDHLEQEVARLGAEVEAASERRGAAQAEADSKKEEAQQLKDKASSLEGQPFCPTCQKPLKPDELERVIAGYGAQRRALGEVYHDAMARVESASAAGAAADAHRVRLQVDVRAGREALQREDRDVHGKLTAAREAASKLAGAREAVAHLSEQITSRAFAQPLLLALQEATTRLTGLGYSEDEHAAIRRELRDLDAFEERYRTYLTAQDRAAMLAESVERGLRALQSRADDEAEAAQALAAALEVVTKAADVTGPLGEAEAKAAGLRAEDEDLTRRIGHAEGRLESIRNSRSQLEQALEKIRGFRDEAETYQTLAKGFGRDGVQAMLIDQALPQLEFEANAMLGHMTGGRIHVQLRTQRKLLGGGTRETLDILISDDAGTRDYEMYSGGEAFRVDFALRIALAKLLAQNKGAELPTLIIDEGFGSQDTEGIDRLVEAIQAVSKEFRLILVVTHVEELKERFERRIDVHKDPVRGSIARVI